MPVGVYDDKEYLPSKEVIDILEKYFLAKIKNKEVVLEGIVIDVYG